MGVCYDKCNNNSKRRTKSQQKSLLNSQKDSNNSNKQVKNKSSNIQSQNNIKKIEESNIKIKPESGYEKGPPALTKYQTKTILYQMSNSICRFDLGKKTGTGFICLIPYPTIEHPLKALITCNHVFNDIKIGNKIKVLIDNNNIEKEIVLDKTRKLYTNDEYDITIIELKDNEFDLNNYLKIDDNLYKNKEIEKNEKIYIIHYPYGSEVKNSIGSIVYIKENKIGYKCETEEGSSGGPICNLNNFNVLGIH